MIEHKSGKIQFSSEKFNPSDYESSEILRWVRTHAWYTICETSEELDAFFKFVKLKTSLTNSIITPAPRFITNAYDGIKHNRDVSSRLLQAPVDHDPEIRVKIPVRYERVNGELVCELIDDTTPERLEIVKKLSNQIQEIQQRIEKAIDLLDDMEENKLKLIKKLEEMK